MERSEGEVMSARSQVPSYAQNRNVLPGKKCSATIVLSELIINEYYWLKPKTPTRELMPCGTRISYILDVRSFAFFPLSCSGELKADMRLMLGLCPAELGF